MARTKFLNVKIDSLKKSELAIVLGSLLTDGKQHTIFTPNPEMLVMASRDVSFRQILNESDVNVADGFGLVLACRLLERQKLDRMTGVETLELLAELCAREGKELMLLGGAPGVAQKAAEKLNHVCSLEAGIVRFDDNGWHMDIMVLERIRSEAPDVLAVALGHGKQERFIHDFLKELPSVRIAIGVGGAFDYLSGTVPRAPHLVRKMGLEWLYRLIREPKRLPRIWTAVVVFPWLVIRAKLKSL